MPHKQFNGQTKAEAPGRKLDTMKAGIGGHSPSRVGTNLIWKHFLHKRD